jgi:hypothetical protein
MFRTNNTISVGFLKGILNEMFGKKSKKIHVSLSKHENINGSPTNFNLCSIFMILMYVNCCGFFGGNMIANWRFLLNYRLPFRGAINSAFFGGKDGDLKETKRGTSEHPKDLPSYGHKHFNNPTSILKFIGKPRRKLQLPRPATKDKVNGKREPASIKNIITNKLIETLYNFCFKRHFFRKGAGCD